MVLFNSCRIIGKNWKLPKIRYTHQFQKIVQLEDRGESQQYQVDSTQKFQLLSPQKKLTSDTLKRQFQIISGYLLPKGYPFSVSPGYDKFALGQMVALTLSSAGGVLSMQALLVAIGVGTATSMPLAATLNWIVKDGLGQLGGILFASFIGNRFDSNPKRWRVLANLSMDAACLLELLTPLAPAHFLLLASVANIGKNIAFLAASASRAAIHKSFAIHENLADVTAKTGSQSILASLAGTSLGLGLASICSGDLSLSLMAFLSCSSLSLGATFLSLRDVTLRTLSRERLDGLLSEVWTDQALLDASRSLILLREMQSQPEHLRDPAAMQALQTSLSSTLSTLALTPLPSPDQMREMDFLLGPPPSPLSPSPLLSLLRSLSRPWASTQQQQDEEKMKMRMREVPSVPELRVGSPLPQALPSLSDLQTHLSFLPSSHYLLSVTSPDSTPSSTSPASSSSPPSSLSVHLLYTEEADQGSVVRGSIHAHLLRRLCRLQPHLPSLQPFLSPPSLNETTTSSFPTPSSSSFYPLLSLSYQLAYHPLQTLSPSSPPQGLVPLISSQLLSPPLSPPHSDSRSHPTRENSKKESGRDGGRWVVEEMQLEAHRARLRLG